MACRSTEANPGEIIRTQYVFCIVVRCFYHGLCFFAGSSLDRHNLFQCFDDRDFKIHRCNLQSVWGTDDRWLSSSVYELTTTAL